MRKPLLGRLLFCIFRPSIKSIKAMTKFQKNSLVWFVIYMVVLGTVIFSTSSCARKGYGCRGNQSWGKMVWRNNRP